MCILEVGRDGFFKQSITDLYTDLNLLLFQDLLELGEDGFQATKLDEVFFKSIYKLLYI